MKILVTIKVFLEIAHMIWNCIKFTVPFLMKILGITIPEEYYT